ncbi:Plasmodium exported protein, unknown function [Plasmodium vivax]|uniref:Fam-l protein n=1 Tax=Plasmodium vivax TaxID=5855 RepID=A0A565A6C7_PLAVI|nr:Plasmodium exported protein, unknown function [Plasmodium vivax]
MGMLIFPKIFTLFLLAWICHYCNDLYLKNNKFNESHKAYGILGRKNYRLLAKNELANKNVHVHLLDKASNYRDNRRMKNGAENITIYKQLGKNNLNKLELYRNDYKKRYNKKSGLAKLECYCEKKVFDKFDHICSLEENIKNGKKHLIKKLYKSYGLPIVLLSLFSLIGIIIPILDKCYNMHPWLSCGINENDQDKHKDCITKLNYICGTNCVLFMPFYIILLSTSIYLFLKFLKYKRLKSGKTKMNNTSYI